MADFWALGVKQEIEDLQKRWQDEGRFRGLHAGMSLEREGVVLGAKTVLAKRLGDGSLESQDARVLTLISVAYGNPVEPSVVGAIRRASKHAHAGDECMASMHIALARLPRLSDPSDAARRLFIADGLMEEGVSPRDIWTALEFDPAPLDALEKFDPNEARVPAGSGRPSGEWTSGKIGSEIIDAAITTITDWAPLIARVGAGPATFIAAMLYSTSGEGRRLEGAVPGRPDLRYSWNGDETELDIEQVSNGQVVMRATLGADGKFRNRGRTIAQETKDGVLVDAAELPSRESSSQPKLDTDEPELCPEPPVKDIEHKYGKEYEQYMRSRINPAMPTPMGLTYALLNPEVPGDLVRYDDCQQVPGAVNASGTVNLPGSMIEYKGPRYAELLKYKWFQESEGKKWLDQALRQVQASQGRQVIWYFAEPESLDFARRLFNKDMDDPRKVIRLELGRPPPGARWAKMFFGDEAFA